MGERTFSLVLSIHDCAKLCVDKIQLLFFGDKFARFCHFSSNHLVLFYVDFLFAFSCLIRKIERKREIDQIFRQYLPRFNVNKSISKAKVKYQTDNRKDRNGKRTVIHMKEWNRRANEKRNEKIASQNQNVHTTSISMRYQTEHMSISRIQLNRKLEN